MQKTINRVKERHIWKRTGVKQTQKTLTGTISLEQEKNEKGYTRFVPVAYTSIVTDDRGNKRYSVTGKRLW